MLRFRRIMIVAALLAIVAIGAPIAIARMFALPGPTGSFQVGTIALAMPGLTSAAGPGTTPLVEIWYPARADPDRAPYGYANEGSRSRRRLVRTHAARGAAVAGTRQRFPVLVYIAGWGGRRTDNTLLAEELASRGFVVAAIDDLSIILPADARLAARWIVSSRAEFDATLEVADAKVTLEARMASAVLNGLGELDRADPAGRFTGRFDLARAGALGFSLGGAAAAEACRQDPRFRAAMNLDGYLFGAVATEGFNQPYFLANTIEPQTPAPDPATSDPGRPFTNELDIADEQHQVAILARTRGYRLEVNRTLHTDFTDDPFFSLRRRLTWHGLDDPLEIMNLLSVYTVAFFDMALNGAPPGPLLTGPPPDRRATLRVFN